MHERTRSDWHQFTYPGMCLPSRWLKEIFASENPITHLKLADCAQYRVDAHNWSSFQSQVIHSVQFLQMRFWSPLHSRQGRSCVADVWQQRYSSETRCRAKTWAILQTFYHISRQCEGNQLVVVDVKLLRVCQLRARSRHLSQSLIRRVLKLLFSNNWLARWAVNLGVVGWQIVWPGHLHVTRTNFLHHPTHSRSWTSRQSTAW